MMHQHITAAPTPEEEAAVRRAKPLYAKMQALRLNLHVDDLTDTQRQQIIADGEGLRAQAVEIAESVGWSENELERVCIAAMRQESRPAMRAAPQPATGAKSVTAASREMALLAGYIARDDRDATSFRAERAKTDELIGQTKSMAALDRLHARRGYLNREIDRVAARRSRKERRRVELVRIIEGEAA